MAKCTFHDCKTQATWAYQPFGPDSTPTFITLGSHYRGFPAMPICDECKELLHKGWNMSVKYRGMWYTAIGDKAIGFPDTGRAEWAAIHGR